MICPNCGNEINNDTTICPFCNVHLKRASETTFKDLVVRDPLGYENVGLTYGYHALLGLGLFFGQSIITILFQLIITSIIKGLGYKPFNANISMFSQILATIICIAIFVFVIRKDLKKILHEFKNGKTWGKAGMYFAFIYLAIIVYSFITVIFRIDQTSANQDSIDQMTYFAPLMSGIYVCLLAPLFEEIVFRFGIYRSLCKINEKMALLIVALIFACMHLLASISTGTLLQDLSSLPVYLIGGVSLTFAYYKEKNIAVPIAIHVIYNTFGFLMGLVA